MAKSDPPPDEPLDPPTGPTQPGRPASRDEPERQAFQSDKVLKENTNWFELPPDEADDPPAELAPTIDLSSRDAQSQSASSDAAAEDTAAEDATAEDDAAWARPNLDDEASRDTAAKAVEASPDRFEPSFRAGDDPSASPTELGAPAPQAARGPSPLETVSAEIAAALVQHAPAPALAKASAVEFHDASPAILPATASDASRPWDRNRIASLCARAGKAAAIVFVAWFCVVLVLIAAYRFINPPFSSLMALQWLGGTSIRQDWVPLESISPNLIRAVVVSEDGRFCEHWGIDFLEIAEALKRTSNGVPRGASTITMQVAKNLFLWPAKSYVRKVIEVPLTYAIELFWPKRRILEVYLNIAEWGPGVFGAEAAAQAHFNRPASRLSARQAAQLAVALPNPRLRDAGAPGPWTARRASVIQRRTGGEPEAVACVEPSR